MRDERSVFQLLGETSASIYPLARDVMRPLFEEYFSEQRFYQVIFFAYNLNPEPITAELYLKRNPYAKPESVLEILMDAVEAGYLEKVEEGEYRPDQIGSDAIEIVHEAFYSHANKLNQYPADQLKELCSLLVKLVDSVKQTDLGIRKISFDASHDGHIHVGHGTLAKVDQHLDDLNAFRDDAHIAAWIPVGTDGHTVTRPKYRPMGIYPLNVNVTVPTTSSVIPYDYRTSGTIRDDVWTLLNARCGTDTHSVQDPPGVNDRRCDLK